jgi:aspartokinase-like uncharacterized kinase
MTDLGIGTVMKVGGAFIEDPATFAVLVDALNSLVHHRDRVLLVPGGGPFADRVRAVDRQLGIGDSAAHWMAILGMDQHAHLLASRIGVADMVQTIDEARAAHAAHRLPVLAPFQWLRAHDPLPHSWAVTSDSIAAWIAIEVGALELVLVKPIAGPAEAVTDAYFPTVLTHGAELGRSLLVRVTGPDLTTGSNVHSLQCGSGEHILTPAG